MARLAGAAAGVCAAVRVCMAGVRAGGSLATLVRTRHTRLVALQDGKHGWLTAVDTL